MREDKQFLREKREELYTRMVELNYDSEQFKRIAKTYRHIPTFKHRMLEMSYLLDREADALDELCIAVETYLKFGKTSVPYIGEL